MSPFANMEDAVDRLVCFHIHQYPPLTVKKEKMKPMSDHELVSKVDQLFELYDDYLMVESKVSLFSFLIFIL